MSFRSVYPPSETDDQQPHSLGYSGHHLNHHHQTSTADHSIRDLYASQNPLNSSLNTSFMSNGSFYQAPSRSYSVQDFTSLPGLAANTPHAVPANLPHGYAQQMAGNPLAGGMYPANGAYQPANSYIDPAYAEWLVKYRQWYDYVQNMRKEQIRQMQPISQRARLTPHRYPHPHARVSFGGSNQLITAKGTIVLVQQIDSSSIDLEEEIQVTTWPGPLIKGETKKDDVLEYIRTRESVLKHDQNPESYFKSHERRQIWSLLSMIVRQNGILSGADLSELLLAYNENEFEVPDDGDEIAKLRRYLTLGQKKTALEFAQKSGLWGHVTSLTLFMTAVPSPSVSAVDSLAIQFWKVVSKFMNSTLSREDPLFILYRSLLTKIQQSPAAAVSTATTGNKQQQVTTETLQQFAILLANDCDVSPSVQDYSRASELLKLIVSIKNSATQHLVNLANLDHENEGSERSFRPEPVEEQNYSDELVFINEIWEFSRPQTEFIERLVPLKTLLAARLFDFSLVNQASRYCYAIRQYFTYYNLYFPGRTIRDSAIDWDAVIDVVTDLECRIYGFDVTKGANDQSNITDKRNEEVEEDKSIAAETDAGTAADGTDLEDDEMDESEQTELPVPNFRPSSKQNYHQSNLLRRESQLSTTSAGTSGERSRAPSSISQANTVTSNNRLPRTRTISQETASPPVSPIKSVPAPGHKIPAGVGSAKSASINAFQPLSVDDRSSSPPASAAGQGNFFIPPVTSNEPIPEFNFVSSFVPPSSTESPLSPNYSDDDAGRRDSIGPFVHNSTAVPGLTSPGQFPNAFSPIAAPQPADQSDQMNGFNQSHQNRSGSFSSHQNHQQSQSHRPGRPAETTGANVSARGSPEPQDRSMNKTGGWFNNLIRKVVPPGAKQAVLPDDKDPSIIYDERLKRWVDKNGTSDNLLLDAIQNGPPRMPTSGMISATSMPQLPIQPGPAPAAAAQPIPNGGTGNNFSFMTGPNRRKPQYVDVWQQQQKQQLHQSRN